MYIDSKNSGMTVWLVKFPSFVARKIHELRPGTALGSLSIIPTQGKDNVVSINLSNELLMSGIPHEYNVQFSSVANNMYVLKNEGKLGKIEGVINKECVVCPVINKNYLIFKKSQVRNNYKREAQTICTQNSTIVEKMGSVKELEILAKKRKKMLQDKKRERLDKNEVMDILFKAFENNEEWTAKELADFSGQPLAYISEILPEVCYMNKKDQRNTWQLKDEYKYQKKFR